MTTRQAIVYDPDKMGPMTEKLIWHLAAEGAEVVTLTQEHVGFGEPTSDGEFTTPWRWVSKRVGVQE